MSELDLALEVIRLHNNGYNFDLDVLNRAQECIRENLRPVAVPAAPAIAPGFTYIPPAIAEGRDSE